MSRVGTPAESEAPHVHTPDHPEGAKEGTRMLCAGEGNVWREMTWVVSQPSDMRHRDAFRCTGCGQKIVLACRTCGTRK